MAVEIKRWYDNDNDQMSFHSWKDENNLIHEHKWYENGHILYQGQRNIHGFPCGKLNWYHENGLIEKTQIYGSSSHQTIRKGKWETFYCNGSPKSLIQYDIEGNECCCKQWYENGKLKESREYSKNGFDTEEATISDCTTLTAAMTCTMKERYDNGNVKTIKNYRNGKLDGEFNQFFDTGSIEERGHYIEGKKNGKWIRYDKSGTFTIISEIHYAQGQILKKIKFYEKKKDGQCKMTN